MKYDIKNVQIRNIWAYSKILITGDTRYCFILSVLDRGVGQHSLLQLSSFLPRLSVQPGLLVWQPSPSKSGPWGTDIASPQTLQSVCKESPAHVGQGPMPKVVVLLYIWMLEIKSWSLATWTVFWAALCHWSFTGGMTVSPKAVFVRFACVSIVCMSFFLIKLCCSKVQTHANQIDKLNCLLVVTIESKQ